MIAERDTVAQAVTYLLDQLELQIQGGECDLSPSDWILVGQIIEWNRHRQKEPVNQDNQTV